MKIGNGHYDPLFKMYIEEMVKELSKYPKKPPSAEQCESTKRALELQKTRPKELDLEWAMRPIPQNYLANPLAKSRDELVGKRDFDAEQVSHIESIRRKEKNTLGQSTQSSVTDESRERAIHAFTYSAPAPLTEAQKAMARALTPITKYAPTIDDLSNNEEKVALWRSLWAYAHLIYGVLIVASLIAVAYYWKHGHI